MSIAAEVKTHVVFAKERFCISPFMVVKVLRCVVRKDDDGRGRIFLLYLLKKWIKATGTDNQMPAILFSSAHHSRIQVQQIVIFTASIKMQWG